MNPPTDEPNALSLDQARRQLQSAISASREMVRKSRMLIALAGARRPVPVNDNHQVGAD